MPRQPEVIREQVCSLKLPERVEGLKPNSSLGPNSSRLMISSAILERPLRTDNSFRVSGGSLALIKRSHAGFCCAFGRERLELAHLNFSSSISADTRRALRHLVGGAGDPSLGPPHLVVGKRARRRCGRHSGRVSPPALVIPDFLHVNFCVHVCASSRRALHLRGGAVRCMVPETDRAILRSPRGV